MVAILKYLAPLSAALLFSTPAMADEDAQAWAAATATIPVDDKIVVWLEAQGRFSDDASRLGQLLLRPGIGYKVSPGTTVFAGYAYVRTDPVGPVRTTEHRIWQQVSWRALGDGKSTTLSGRSRLEQRFVNGTRDVGVRFRQLLRLTTPVSKSGVQAVGWSELFLGLNDTQAGQRTGFDRLRSFAGVSVPVGKSLRLEPGYMNEYVKGRTDDRANHIASLTMNLNF